MSPQEILAKAYQRARYATHTPRSIPIREIRQVVDIPVTRLKPEPPKIVPKIEEAPQFPTVGSIVRGVAEFYNISLADMCSIRRTKPVCVPRQVAMYLARTYTPRSFPEIGRMLGGRDHTTVLHGYRKVKELLETDNDLAAQIEQLEQKLSLSSQPLVDRTAGAADNAAQPVGA